MSGALTEERAAALRDKLRQRWNDLKAILHQELIASDEQHYIELAGQVHDLQDESVADLLIDIDLAVIDLHLKELQAIEAALRRMDGGAYGVCDSCEEPIDSLRLEVYPTALRCARCQERYEETHAGNAHPSL